MSNIVPFESGAIPAHAQRRDGQKSLSGSLSAHDSKNRIVLKGGLWRLEVGGKEAATHNGPLQVVLIDRHDHVNRAYYEGAYDPSAEPRGPDCQSSDGKTPLASSPKRQHPTCNGCPQNVKIEGKGRNCSFKQRIVVTLPTDETNRLFRIDVPAMSIFDKGQPAGNLFGFQGYANRLDEMNVAFNAVVTELVPDTSQSVAKYFFKPVGYLPAERIAEIESIDPEQIAEYVAIDRAMDAAQASAGQPEGGAMSSASSPAPTQPTVQPTVEPEVTAQPTIPASQVVIDQPVADTTPVDATPAQGAAPEQTPESAPAEEAASPVLASADELLKKLV